MSWKPEGEDKKYVKLVVAMGMDALLGEGVANRETFIDNLRLIANGMEGRSQQ